MVENTASDEYIVKHYNAVMDAYEVPSQEKPQMSLRMLFVLVSLSALMWGLIGGGLTALVAQQPEDGLFFNCYISGNGVCGPEATWTGFVNLF